MAYSVFKWLTWDGEKRTWRIQLAKLFVFPHGDIRESVRCEAKHNAEAASEAVRISFAWGY